jgi:hypothetical protein
MSDLPHWVQVLQALLTPTIALVVGLIAYRQWKTAHAKLVLDLFEKRMDVYNHVRKSVAVVNATGRTSPEAEMDLLEAKERAEFLFGVDVRQYLEKMWDRFIKLHAACGMLEGSVGAERRSHIDAQSRLCNEITQFYYEGADVFSPYMRMEHRLRRPVKNPRQRPNAMA